LPQCIKVKRHCAELLLIRRRGSELSRRDHIEPYSAQLERRACQPANLKIRTRDHLSGGVPAGLPSQRSGYADAKCDQEANDGKPTSLAEPLPLALELV
jgi:hypothetical protein